MTVQKSAMSAYFRGLDDLPTQQRDYIVNTLAIWQECGLLDLAVRSGMSMKVYEHLDEKSLTVDANIQSACLLADHFEKEQALFAQFGVMSQVKSPVQDYVEVRLNLVVPHELAHQVEFLLPTNIDQQIWEMYTARLERCNETHPLPDEYDGLSELVRCNQVDTRFFQSGYARTSPDEYWAESFAGFSVKQSRDDLAKRDPDMHELLRKLVYEPNNIFSHGRH